MTRQGNTLLQNQQSAKKQHYNQREQHGTKGQCAVTDVCLLLYSFLLFHSSFDLIARSNEELSGYSFKNWFQSYICLLSFTIPAFPGGRGEN
jgi:hypothetical protein